MKRTALTSIAILALLNSSTFGNIITDIGVSDSGVLNPQWGVSDAGGVGEVSVSSNDVVDITVNLLDQDDDNTLEITGAPIITALDFDLNTFNTWNLGSLTYSGNQDTLGGLGITLRGFDDFFGQGPIENVSTNFGGLMGQSVITSAGDNLMTQFAIQIEGTGEDFFTPGTTSQGGILRVSVPTTEGTFVVGDITINNSGFVAVPEPATLTLLGFSGLALLTRRIRKN